MSASRAFVPASQSSAFWLPWEQWESVAVNISRVPREADTKALWNAFSREGEIRSIDIFDDRHGARSLKGRIRFKRPPTTVFWRSGVYQIPLPGRRVVYIGVALDRSCPSPFLKSPSRENVFYPRESQELPCKRCDIGVLVDGSTTCAMRTFSDEAKPRMVVDVRAKALFAHFNVVLHHSRPVAAGVPEMSASTYRLKIPFLQLARVWEAYEEDSHEVSLVIILDSPPLYHRQSTDILTTFSTQTTWRDSDAWLRQTSIAHSLGHQVKAPTSLRRVGQIIDLGRWNVFKFTFSTDHLLETEFKLVQEMLKDHNVFIEGGKHFKSSPERPDPVWRWIDIPDSKTRFSSTLEEIADQDYVHLPFAVRYQLEVCISHGHLSEFTMSRQFVVHLMDLGVASAVKLLEHVATERKQYLDPMKIFNIKYGNGVSGSIIPAYCCFMRSARVTPTTIHYNTPTLDASNRVTRHYQEYLDRFLRVRFTDEKSQGRIYSTSYRSNDEIFTRVKRTLANGITIGDRHYEFLAFGNSQFREHGAYFFAPTSNLTAAHIRAWMGQFNHIRNVARYAARLGQCFSTTRALAGCRVNVKRIPDILRNGHCFSDGVGKISKFTTRIISNEMGVADPYGRPPSAYQFRLGGCKGMLTYSSDPTVNDVHIRPSQFKFEAGHNRLEIIRWSQFSAATLNRQLILVLSAQGVKNQVFHDRLNVMLESINYAMNNDNQAIELLQKFVDPNQITLSLSQMVSAGFRSTKEPFVSSLLGLWKSWHKKHLKEKAKILIEHGASLLGVLDETGTLKGYFDRQVTRQRVTEKEKLAALPQIFVQISSMEKGVSARVIQGVCIVARNPSLHPGDIRVVHAVDCHELRHLVDVVVFPQTGDRDITSMCSGGDLDGDDYLVIWDKDLIPRDWFTRPWKYATRKAPDLDRDVTVDDITSFYVTYMKNDSLPRIAHAHMAHADRLANGVREPKCIRLAQLHSDAVDYNKTGSPAIMGRDLEPHIWPHFMDKRHKRTYQSKKILGQLYDAVKMEDFSPSLSNPFDSRILQCDLVGNSKKYDHFASELKVEYDASMRRIMAKYGIQTEFEIWSAFVLKHSGMCRDYKLHEELGTVASSLRLGFREQCYKEVGKRDFGQIAPLVVSMYRITHQEVQDTMAARRGENRYDDDDDDGLLPDERETEIIKMPLISFPWVFDGILCKIARSAAGELRPAQMEAKALDAKNNIAKTFSHAEVMKIMGQIEDSEFIAKFEGDQDEAKLPAKLDRKLGMNEPQYFGDEDLYENNLCEDRLYEVAGGDLSLAPNEVQDVVKAERLVNPSAVDESSEGSGWVVEDAQDGVEVVDEDDEAVDIVELEGDVKPSAMDELIALLGDGDDEENGDWRMGQVV
ncbi:uncharacterized protein N7482_009735 [Penicillium canariense]|uniref:RNA-dependent RNA polymerase n=1 Tax=Penicillium canariense TaxID=189055 RepID=A0A9W9HQ02_9EURO|nr:uncharacterized protein N7482_009735 [Penicillium canariense]KAJ5153257.1 hypothetical protein N7482_009735 [Penicillium canariense]